MGRGLARGRPVDADRALEVGRALGLVEAMLEQQHDREVAGAPYVVVVPRWVIRHSYAARAGVLTEGSEVVIANEDGKVRCYRLVCKGDGWALRRDRQAEQAYQERMWAEARRFGREWPDGEG